MFFFFVYFRFRPKRIDFRPKNDFNKLQNSLLSLRLLATQLQAANAPQQSLVGFGNTNLRLGLDISIASPRAPKWTSPQTPSWKAALGADATCIAIMLCTHCTAESSISSQRRPAFHSHSMCSRLTEVGYELTPLVTTAGPCSCC
jgi:hypothetical protein